MRNDFVEIEVPPVDPVREQALLAAFDRHWARPRAAGWRLVWVAATTALLIATVSLNWMVVSDRGGTDAVMSDLSVDLTGFVTLPGVQAWPRFESGAVVRVDLPVSALPALGLMPPASAATVVQADLIVGQDGFARAVRLVQP
jgi:hypothetical protein